MKRILLIFICLPALVNAQDSLLNRIFPYKEGRVVYQGIVNVEGSTKLKLFEKAKIWSLKTFVSSKDAQQSENKDLGFITFKTFYNEPVISQFGGNTHSHDQKFWITVKVYLKEERAKIMIDNIIVEYFEGNKRPLESIKFKTAGFAYKSKEDSIKMSGDYQNLRISVEKSYQNADVDFKKLIESFKAAMISKPENDF